MWLRVEHRLHFAYDGWISQSHMNLRVEPRTTSHQTLRSFLIAVGPPTRVHRHLDWIGNHVHRFSIHDFHDRIEVLVRSLVRTHPQALTPTALARAPRPMEQLEELLDWVRFDGPVTRSSRLEALARELPVAAGEPLGAQVEGIGRFVHQRFRYVPEVTDWKSTSDHLLETGAGVCQDFTHVMLALLRLRGIPCRYVSGYLHTDSAGSAQSHAWVEVHAGEPGWVGYDPTHARPPDERYVVVASGRHYDDVPPNRGIYRGTAREILGAEVRTEEAGPPDVAGLHEETAAIEVPVFREIPVPSRASDAALPEAQQEQQQQQARGAPEP